MQLNENAEDIEDEGTAPTFNTLWRTQVHCSWAQTTAIQFIVFSLPKYPSALQKAMRIPAKMQTALHHTPGVRIASRRHPLRHSVYMLLYCHKPTTLTPCALEEELQVTTPYGDTLATPNAVYRYFLNLLHTYIQEVTNTYGQLR